MSTQRMVEFVVSGSGGFPIDMMRFDSCWPRTETDAGLVESTFRRGSNGVVEVAMKGLAKPTEARWSSFGWAVGSISYASSGRWST